MNIIHQRRQKELINACEKALLNPKYRRRKKKTYCNLAARWIAEQMGAVTKITDVFLMWTRSGQKWITGTANAICKNAERLAKKEKGNLREIDEKKAQELAWIGIPILVCWKNPKRFRSGHVAIVWPTDPLQEPLEICNIGWNNLKCQPENPKAFGDRIVKYYQLPVILI